MWVAKCILAKIFRKIYGYLQILKVLNSGFFETLYLFLDAIDQYFFELKAVTTAVPDRLFY